MVVAEKYAEFSFFSQSSIICKKGNAGVLVLIHSKYLRNQLPVLYSGGNMLLIHNELRTLWYFALNFRFYLWIQSYFPSKKHSIHSRTPGQNHRRSPGESGWRAEGLFWEAKTLQVLSDSIWLWAPRTRIQQVTVSSG